MEEWYKDQKFFSKDKLDRIYEWIKKDLTEIMFYNTNIVQQN
jgi:hypothetical protein